MRYTLASVLALILAAGSMGAEEPGPPLPDEEADRTIVAVIEDRIDQHHGRFGIVVGLQDGRGGRVFSAGQARDDVQVDGRSLFNLGSVTKVFTATLLADMVARGEVGLEDPVDEFLPPGVRAPGRNGKKITLLHLATHTSGLPTSPGNSPSREDGRPGYVGYSVDRLYAFLASYSLTRDPGSEFEYSNLGMGLLGHVLSLAGGKPLEELIRERICRPLGMSHTAWRETLSAERGSRLTEGRYSNGEPAPHWVMPPVLAGAGGMHSSADDMLKFISANLHPDSTALAPAIRLARQPRKDMGLPGGGVGLGWSVTQEDDVRLLTHSGGVDGYNSFLGIDLTHRRGVVVMANSSVDVMDIGVAILLDRLKVPEAGSKPKARQDSGAAVDRSRFGEYLGMYEIAPGFHFLVSEHRGRLYLQAPRRPRYEMEAESESSFMIREGEETAHVRMIEDADGRVTGLRIRQGVTEISASKVAGPATAEVDPTVFDGYLGQYEIAPDLFIVISREEGRLFAQAGRQARVELFPRSKTEYFSKLDDMRITFVANAEGRANELVWYRAGTEKRGRRLPEKAVFEVNPGLLEDYVGQYQVTPEFKLTVTTEKGRLFVQGSHQPRFELFPESEDLFFLKAVNGKIRFRRGEDGNVVQSVVIVGQKEEVGTRIP
jgi:CubicO group peptidase (beta-lactamase class C family)